MSNFLDEFKAKCKDISNKFNVDENVSACFLVNYSKDSDICRDCSRNTECSKMIK